ncbi:MAG: hypothetical protein A2042_07410 [Candidatus Schekmanbacteria bacterium GWA2_38_11]|uniref:Zinc-finger domain-containing protein n=1 Tax=Candidatus Schekmanbacteria bacterium GWA2_38_11 TaxID=1817876 RepID=A0A1F7RQ73_9BACT|nr:MAG: hypothetical protein A2042_07410 [Candidatus Schekmanbacteria bacterium GWA2_38_11]
MKCEDVDLIGFLEGVKISESAREHILGCDKCKSEIEDIKTSSKLLERFFEREVAIEAELPTDIKKKIRQMKVEYLSSRLKDAMKAVKAKGEVGIEKIKEIVKETLEGGKETVPVPASPEDITEAEKEEGEEEKEEGEIEPEDNEKGN